MSHDESLARTYAERKAERLAEYGLLDAVADVQINDQSREIRRLRRALREIKEIHHKEYDARCERHVKVTCYCPRCLCCRIATRALKRKTK